MRTYSRGKEKGMDEEVQVEEGGETEKGYAQAPLLSVGEAARYLGVSRKILYQLLERGELLAVKARGKVLLEKKGLDEFRASGRLT